MKRQSIIVACVAAVLIMCGALPPGASALRSFSFSAKPQEKKRAVMATVVSVNPVTRSLAATAKGRERVFQVAPLALILINDRSGKLSDIKKDARARIVYLVDRSTGVETAIEIDATQPVPRSFEHGKQESRPAR